MAGRRKVKSGCRTCKIRRVKCDEGRPACKRCVSTGRTCDGYGIWGGGNRTPPRKQPNEMCLLSRPQSPPSLLPANSSRQKAYLDWFRHRAVTKLPGSFDSRFWNILLLQSSITEPAVLHAILALSSIHRVGVANIGKDHGVGLIPDEDEKYALQQYTKAIAHLQPHFLVKDRASSKVALITCLVFVYIELLRGHFETAEVHLQNGIKILMVLQMLSKLPEGGIFCWKLGNDSTDEWIVEAFSRLHLQFELFKHGYQHSCLVLQPRLTNTPLTEFNSFNDAWLQLEKLLNKIFYINYHSRQHKSTSFEPSSPPLALEKHQEDVRNGLCKWLRMLDAFVKGVPRDRATDLEMTQEKRYHGLYLIHTMATIMAETCSQPGNESIYDEHTEKFTLIVTQAPKLWMLALEKIPIDSLPIGSIDMARSMIEVGWIPPLFYTAIKCRVHRIRVQAIRLLQSSSHREGIWDSRVVVCVAKKVLALEEGDFYQDEEMSEDFSLFSSPSLEDLALPTLPESRRLREVEINLIGAPMDRIQLFCIEERDSKDCRILKAEYNVRSQVWRDVNLEA